MITMILLLFLSTCVCLGHSSDTIKYGSKYRIRGLRWIRSVEFMPTYSTETIILWDRAKPDRIDTRRKMEGDHFMIYDVTQQDSGQYILRNNGIIFSTKTLEVVANTQTISLMSGEQLSFSYDLPPIACNIYFIPEFDHEIQIVRKGVLDPASYDSGCVGFDVLLPCGVVYDAAQMSCAGRFEVRDHNDDNALTVFLEMKPSKFNSTYLSAGIGALVFSLLSCCLKYCCCGKSSSKKDSTESDAGSDAGPDAAAAAPAPAPVNNGETPVFFHKMCNPPTEVPPPYSEVSALAEQTDAPTFPLCSDHEPHFEIKGMNFISDTQHTEVYTSDKLNFR